MNIKLLNYLEKKIYKLREAFLEVCYRKGGHVATSFSCSEILSYLYFNKIIKLKKKIATYLL